MRISLIVATSENGVIGKDGDMPWGRNMPADLEYFKEVTNQGRCNYVLMGRKTYDSIGRKLPGREGLIITRERDREKTKHINGFVYNTIQDAIDYTQGLEYFLKLEHDIFIIGGASIYEQAMQMGIVDKIYHTLIHANVEGDTFFNIPDGWGVVSTKPHLADDKNMYDYTFRTLTKVQDLSSEKSENSLFE